MKIVILLVLIEMFEEDEDKDFEEYLNLFLGFKFKRGKLFVN